MYLSVLLLAVCSITANGQRNLDCSHCVCSSGTANCRGIGLTSIPALHSFAPYKRLDLSNNSLSTVHASAFQGMPNLIDIDLSDNALTTMDTRALKFAENITKLSLRKNHLQALPTCLTELKRLEILDIVMNPIQPDDSHFQSSIMRHLGATLKELHFGHPSVYMWPQATSHLQALEILDLNGASIAFLPPSFSRGFERRLKSLTIQNTQLATTPIMTSLENLEELHLDNNPFHDYGILESSFIGLTRLKTLSLNHDLLQKFPGILKQLPALTKLALDGNSYYFVSDDSITLIHGTKITELSLRDCNLDRVPGSITGDTLSQLKMFDLSKNNINSIDRFDLSGLHNLQNISFSQNPLKYISDHALNLTGLQYLDMSSTHITTIPKAIYNMPNILTINLEGNQIDCTCDLIWFEQLYKSSHSKIDLRGKCETIDRTVLRYLADFVPKCPDYPH